MLIMDRLKCHTMEPFMELLRMHNVTVVLMVAQSSHLTQPLDVGIFWRVKNLIRADGKYAIKLDELDESAVKCGSTNTVLVRDGRLIAYNTDGWGLIRALEDQGICVAGKRVVMLGAGGVASSIAYNLSINRASSVDVVNLFPEQAEALCQKFGEGFTPYPLSYPVLAERCKGADLFINASVMGQLGYDEFQTFDFLDNMAPGAAVFDVNYSNPNSKLVPTALAKGMHAFKGRRMTACQGIRAISIWTGREPSRQATEALIADFEAMDQGVQEK